MSEVIVNYWSNAEGGFKAVTLDVFYSDSSPRLQHAPVVYTELNVYAAAHANLEVDILAVVRRGLDKGFG